MKLINNKFIVDDCDYEELAKKRWREDKGYARREVQRNGVIKVIYMHNEILKTPNGFQGDHINGNTYDNRRSNLRIATLSQNRANISKKRNNTSGYKGVSWHKCTNKWMASLRKDNKQIYLGLFIDIEEAAKAYNEAAKKYHGEFARLNELKKASQS